MHPSLRPRTAILFCALILSACEHGRNLDTTGESDAISSNVASQGSPVRTGAEVLVRDRFEMLAGRRVGLIANHTSRVDTVHLGDVLAEAPEVNFTAFFAPEHGIRGTAEAGEEVVGSIDARTGLPVHSLYGNTRKPTPEMMRGVDVLVFDIQDVGARFYTYISTMGLSMQAAAEAGVAFAVLDRPNPLGGEYVGGFMLEPEYASFVGQFEIPIAHGLTVGELARMIQGEQLLPGLEQLELHVVPMEGWSRSMQWPATGLPWISPSPNIPDYETALVYPGTCLFEAINANEGRGTFQPFRLLGAPYVDADSLVRSLEHRNLPGVAFEPVVFSPQSIQGMATSPRFLNTSLEGVRITVTASEVFQPVETGIHLIDAFREQARREGETLVSRPDALRRLAGTDDLESMLEDGTPPDRIIDAWRVDVERFVQQRRPYLLYD